MAHGSTLVAFSLILGFCALGAHGEIPINYAEAQWILHVPVGHTGPVFVPYVEKPAGVALAKKETPLPFTHEDGTLTVDLSGIDCSSKAVDVAILWPDSHWEETIKRFERKELKRPLPKDAVLFVGSSSIVGWDVAKCFPDVPTINRGFGGSQFVDAIRYADRVVIKHKPKAVVIYDGDNDVNAGKSAEWVLADCTRLVGRIRQDLPKTPVFVLSIKTSKARWKLHEEMRRANGLMEAYAKATPGVTYIDVDTPLLDAEAKPRDDLFRDDKLHLRPEGYAIWTDILSSLLKKLYE